MSGAPDIRPRRPRAVPLSWGIWAERAVVRALEIDPDSYVQEGLLCGQPASHVALAVARAIGYLTGTQRAPDLCAPIRAWLDHVGMTDGEPKGGRLGGLSWGEWAERASVIALEIDPELRVQTILLHGQFAWELAMTIARSIAFLAGVRRANVVPAEIRNWLQQTPRMGMSEEDTIPTEERPR